METELLIARISDTANICAKTSKPKFLGFLSPEQAALAEKTLKKHNVSFGLWGGYEGAERVMLGCFPEWAVGFDYPVAAVTFSYRKTDDVGHRDVLGSLMGLGLKRESVGDILLEQGRAVVFCAEEIADYIISQTEKIGRTGVKAILGFTQPLPEKKAMSESTVTVASERLDCVVSALAGISRGTAAEKISDGVVSVNSVVTEKPTKLVSTGDILTVRGSGKFIIESLDGRTKKNRIVLVYKKYT